MAKAKMYFPPDFLWGTATAAHQVEGNNVNNDWWQWEQVAGNILNGDRSGLACNWWADAEADLDRAAEMGINAHRLSLEWSRIEPEPSVFDKDALERYRQILQGLHDRDIEPMVALHHFSNPTWLVEKGDFDTSVVVDYFQRYTAKVVSVLGDLIPKWITINEPLVYIMKRYLHDTFPAPEQNGWSAGMRAARHMLRCHAVAYHTIKEAQGGSMVGVAKHIRPVEPWQAGSKLDAWWARRASWFYNDLWMHSMVDGRLRWPLGRGTVKHLKDTFDYVGINYSTRARARFPTRPDRPFHSEPQTDGAFADNESVEIYPQGFYKAIVANLRYDKPIYITGNGLPDAADRHRPSYLLSHLREVWRALNFSFPVMGYYHWTLVDSFAWERGWTQRFGLIELDPETQKRQWRPSAHLYSEICRGNHISSDMAERYAPDLLETLFPGSAPAPEAAAEQEDETGD